MQEFIFYISTLLLGIILVGFFRKIFLERKIVGIDINKKDKPLVAESLGLAVLVNLLLGGIFLFDKVDVINLALFLSTIFFFGIFGFIDDIRPKFLSKQISWNKRALIIAIGSLALAYFYAKGDLFFAILFALFLAGLASLQNTFAGLNGWEIGSGFIISIFVSFLLWNTELKYLALLLNASILALLAFNIYPAKVFPGDSGTLLIGSGIASLLLLGGKFNFLILGLLFYFPHIIDFFILKLLTNPKDVSQQKEKPYSLTADGKISIPNYKGRIKYDFAKLLLKIFGPQKEYILVLIIWIIVFLNCLIMLALFGY